MRLFTAIELPEPVKAHLAGLRAELAKTSDLSHAVSWVKPENVHVTLKFLGEVRGPTVNELCEALARVNVEPMRLFPAEMVVFPKRGPVRLIAAGLAGDVERLKRLYADIEDACASVGFERDRRAYTPHATLGRARPGRSSPGLRNLREAPALEAGPRFTADGFVLMCSELNPRGAIYTSAAHFPPKSGT